MQASLIRLEMGLKMLDSWNSVQLMGLAGGRVVLALEGGYSSEATPGSFLACIRALLRDPSSSNIPSMCALLPDTPPLIEKVM